MDHLATEDVYGFRLDEEFDRRTYKNFMDEYFPILVRRRQRWHQVVRKPDSKVKKSPKIKRFVRKGVPSALRPMVWMHVSGAHKLMQANPGVYQTLKEVRCDVSVLDAINLDIQRTFPNNIYFDFQVASDPKCLLFPLRNVLIAFANQNPDIGYCQGLNFIAGIMLLVIKDEEKVFWLLSTLVNDILPAGYFTKDLRGVHCDYEVLGELIRERLPSVHKVIDEEGIALSMILTKWFVCLFVDVLPIETLLRVWDCLFYEGSKILFRVALSMIKSNETQLLRCKTLESFMTTFKAITNSKVNFFCHTFMKDVFELSNPLSSAKLDSLRVLCYPRVI